MKVAEWMEAHPSGLVTLAPECTLDEALTRMLAGPCLRDLYVVDARGVLLGHLSHRQLAALVLARHRPVHTLRELMNRVATGRVRELMQRGFPVARPDEELDDVLHRQLEHDVEDMPVVGADGKLLGAVNLSEVLRAALREELDGA